MEETINIIMINLIELKIKKLINPPVIGRFDKFKKLTASLAFCLYYTIV